MVLIKQLNLKLVKIDEPEVIDFPDMTSQDWYIEGTSSIERRMIFNFYFKTHCTTDLDQGFPLSILE